MVLEVLNVRWYETTYSTQAQFITKTSLSQRLPAVWSISIGSKGFPTLLGVSLSLSTTGLPLDAFFEEVFGDFWGELWCWWCWCLLWGCECGWWGSGMLARDGGGPSARAFSFNLKWQTNTRSFVDCSSSRHDKWMLFYCSIQFRLKYNHHQWNRKTIRRLAPLVSTTN